METILDSISKSICKIEYNEEGKNKIGAGFLVILPIPDSDNPIRGLITCNSVINQNILSNSKKKLNFTDREITIDCSSQTDFCFTDPFLNITFIELKKPEYDGFEFINIEENDDISEYAYIINDTKEKNISKGKISTKWGYKILHTLSTNEDLLGSPLISLEDNQILGVHSENNVEDIDNNILSVAISMKATIQAIRIVYNSYIHNRSLFTEKENGIIQKELKLLTNIEIDELKAHGLEATSNPEVFISPKSLFVTPLWFYRTNYAWYWTPIEPKNNCIEKPNWIIIYPGCSLKVIGGKWDLIEPAEKNITLIHWLESTGSNYLI